MDPFAKEVIREIDVKVDDIRRVILAGIRDSDEYWRCVGLHQGLQSIREYVVDLANRAERDDDN